MPPGFRDPAFIAAATGRGPVTPPAAPGLVILDPQGDGVHYQMPALPAGAASLILQKSDDGGVNWNNVATGLAGSATGIDAGGAAIYNQLLTFAVANPGTSYADTGSNSPINVEGSDPPITATIDFTASGGLLTSAVHHAGNNVTNWEVGLIGLVYFAGDANATVEVTGITRGSFSNWGSPTGFGNTTVRYRAKNNTGETGTAVLVTTAAIPDAPVDTPTADNFVEEEPGQYSFDVTLPIALPDRATFFKMYCSGSAGEPADDRGQFAPSAVWNTNESEGTFPCGTTISMGVKAGNIYGVSAMTYDDTGATPDC